MKNPASVKPEKIDVTRENENRLSLRSEVDEFLATARAEAAGDYSTVTNGCRGADILQRGEDIRARNGLPPNPLLPLSSDLRRAKPVSPGKDEHNQSWKFGQDATVVIHKVALLLGTLSSRVAAQVRWLCGGR